MKVASREISQAVIRRLPRYYRYLGELLESGVERISSNELSKRMKVTASQIRQDLNNFGGFGQQGYGYNVKYLYTEIGKILGLNEKHKFVIIGAGNLGQALANYAAFENRGFVLKGLFDVNPRLAGLTIRGVEIRMMDELKDFVKENDIEIGVLTIPKTKAVEVAKEQGTPVHVGSVVSSDVFYSDDPEKALMHGPTFMGNPLACSAALKSIQLFEEEDYMTKIHRITEITREEMNGFTAPQIKEIRIMGGCVCIEVHDGACLKGYPEFAYERGVFNRPFLNFLYAMVPYIIEEEELVTVLRTMKAWFLR